MSKALGFEAVVELLGDVRLRLVPDTPRHSYAFTPAEGTEPAFFLAETLSGGWVRLEMWADWRWVG